MKQQFFLKTGFVFISIVVSLGICEILIRVIPLKHFDKTRFGVLRPHLTRGFEFVPNVSKQRWGVDWNINSRGFRDYEHSPQTKGFKIVGLGDSFFVGHEVGFEDTFLRQLEKELKLEVIKLAVTSYGTIQERLLWEEEGKNYHPGLVLLGVYVGNDLEDNVRFPDDICIYRGLLVHCGDSGSKLVQFARFSARYSLFSRLFFQQFYNHHFQDRAGDESLNNDSLFRNMNLVSSLYDKNWPQSLTKGFHLLTENISKLNQSVTRMQADLIVVIIPTELQIYDWEWEKALQKIPGNSLDRYKVIRLTSSWLESNGIRYVNLLPAFKKAAETDQNLHPQHWHWSVAANKLAAKTVEDSLRKDNLIPKS